MTNTTAQVAYHRHTGRPIGIVTKIEANGYRGTTGLGSFVVAKRDAILRAATAEQIERFAGVGA